MVIELVGCFGFFLDFLVGPAVIGLCCAPMAIMAIAVDALTAAFQAVSSSGCMLHRIATTSTNHFLNCLQRVNRNYYLPNDDRRKTGFISAIKSGCPVWVVNAKMLKCAFVCLA